MTELITAAQVLVAGSATGRVLCLDEPVSFWGGVDIATGRIIDQRHPQVGVCVTETILVMAVGRGSSSASSTLAEAIHRGTAPAAILLGEPDEILAIGAIVADELYGRRMPMLVLDRTGRSRLTTGLEVAVDDEVVRI